MMRSGSNSSRKLFICQPKLSGWRHELFFHQILSLLVSRVCDVASVAHLASSVDECIGVRLRSSEHGVTVGIPCAAIGIFQSHRDYLFCEGDKVDRVTLKHLHVGGGVG